MKKILRILMLLLSALAGAVAGCTVTLKKMRALDGKKNKFRLYYDTMNQWLLLKNEGKSLEGYFIQNGYRTMAIYGMGELGNRLYEELSRSDQVEVKYAIDINLGFVYSGDVKVILPEDDLEQVDVIIVTPIFDFDDIYNNLAKKTNCPIVSLEEVVFET